MARDPYDVLGVERGAALERVRGAYRTLIALYHPDRLVAARPEVREEGSRKLREVVDAYHAIEAVSGPGEVAAGTDPALAPRRAGPLRAHHGPPAMPGRTPRPAGDAGPHGAVTDPHPFGPAMRIFDAELEAVAPIPRLHVRWGGRHARDALAALHRLHGASRDAVRQLEWGSYQLELRGVDMARFLVGLVPEDPTGEEPVVVVSLATSLQARLAADGGPPPEERSGGRRLVALRRVLALLEPDGRYTLTVDSL